MEKPHSYEAKSPSARYAVLFDPMDGSSNIDVNGTLGTIFSIRRRRDGTVADLLRAGHEQVAAGYFLFGPAVLLVYTCGDGVHLFALDPAIGEFLLVRREVRMPERGKGYAVNEGRAHAWAPGVRAFVEHLKTPDPKTGRVYATRYSASLVGDVHRFLLEGGIYLYPADAYGKGGRRREAARPLRVPSARVRRRAGGRPRVDRTPEGSRRRSGVAPRAHAARDRQPHRGRAVRDLRRAGMTGISGPAAVAARSRRARRDPRSVSGRTASDGPIPGTRAPMKPAALAAALAVLAAARPAAHDFWIEPSAFQPAVGSTLGVRLVVGQRFRGDVLPRNPALIARFDFVTDQGSVPVAGRAADDPAGTVKIEQPGLGLIAYRSLESPLSLEADRFEEYLKEEGLEAVIAARAKQGDSRKPSKELFSRAAKSLVRAGGSGDSGFDRVLGLTLEIVPEKNPYAMAGGGDLPVRLLFEGKPLSGALVAAMPYDAPEKKLSARSDRDGRVTLQASLRRRLARQGRADVAGGGKSERRLAQHLGLADVRGPRGAGPGPVRRRALAAAILGFAALGGFALAHELGTIRVVARFRKGGAYEIDAIIDRQHLPPGFGAGGLDRSAPGPDREPRTRPRGADRRRRGRRDRRSARRLRREERPAGDRLRAARSRRGRGSRRAGVDAAVLGRCAAGREDVHVVQRRRDRHLHADDPHGGAGAGARVSGSRAPPRACRSRWPPASRR